MLLSFSLFLVSLLSPRSISITAPTRRKPTRPHTPVDPPYFLRSKARRNNLVSDFMATSGDASATVTPSTGVPSSVVPTSGVSLPLVHTTPPAPPPTLASIADSLASLTTAFNNVQLQMTAINHQLADQSSRLTALDGTLSHSHSRSPVSLSLSRSAEAEQHRAITATELRRPSLPPCRTTA